MTNLISQSAVPAANPPATVRPPRPPSWVLKVVMAVTGVVLVGFLLFHMAGNLKVFLGAEEFNHYAEWLRTLFNPLLPGESFLWVFRAVMLSSFVAHIYSAVTLRVRARRARGPHRRGAMPAKRWSVRSMLMTGAIILSFVIFHLLDLTIGRTAAATDEFTAGDAYGNLVASFERPAVALFYALTMLLIAIHLSHGLWSVVNDLGATGQRTRRVGLLLAGAIAIVIALGNMMIPIAVQLGWVA
ncbi:MAG: succinate dehydrogenase cytochrome b subunit [Candidatus Nanopelagicales bacterium]